jgi:hypothetical protein
MVYSLCIQRNIKMALVDDLMVAPMKKKVESKFK